MSTFIIHTGNEEQIQKIQSLLEELKLDFEIKNTSELTDWQKEEINLGIKDIENNQFVSSKEVRQKVAELCSK